MCDNIPGPNAYDNYKCLCLSWVTHPYIFIIIYKYIYNVNFGYKFGFKKCYPTIYYIHFICWMDKFTWLTQISSPPLMQFVCYTITCMPSISTSKLYDVENNISTFLYIDLIIQILLMSSLENTSCEGTPNPNHIPPHKNTPFRLCHKEKYGVYNVY